MDYTLARQIWIQVLHSCKFNLMERIMLSSNAFNMEWFNIVDILKISLGILASLTVIHESRICLWINIYREASSINTTTSNLNRVLLTAKNIVYHFQVMKRIFTFTFSSYPYLFRYKSKIFKWDKQCSLQLGLGHYSIKWKNIVNELLTKAHMYNMFMKISP